MAQAPVPQPQMTPGMDIAQGAPADIGSLNPIVALIKYLTQIMGPQVPPPTPSPWAQGGAPGQMPMPPADLKGKMTQGY